MKIPNIIHQFHMGKPPSAQTLAWIDTVKKHHPSDYRMWDGPSIINEFGLNPETLPYPHPGGWSNIIRFITIQRFGGIWLDTDVECFDSVFFLNDLCEKTGHTAFTSFAGEDNLSCGVFGATPNHPWLAALLERSKFYVGHRAEWGPKCMTDVPLDLKQVKIFPPEVLGSSWWWNTPKEQREVRPGVKMVHHWAGSWL